MGEGRFTGVKDDDDAFVHREPGAENSEETRAQAALDRVLNDVRAWDKAVEEREALDREETLQERNARFDREDEEQKGLQVDLNTLIRLSRKSLEEVLAAVSDRIYEVPHTYSRRNSPMYRALEAVAKSHGVPESVIAI